MTPVGPFDGDTGSERPSDAGLEVRFTVTRPSGFTLHAEFDIAVGTTMALLGPNGAGKSTAVAAIAGLTEIDSGHIRLGGRSLDDGSSRGFVPPEDRRVGVVFQQYLLFEHLNVVDNISFGLVSRGSSKRAGRAAVGALVEAFDLTDLAMRKPSELSGGQAQRVAMARAVATEPDLLLLDEPLAALDVRTRAHLRRFLASHLADFAGPRLLITHDPADAFLLADEICVLEDGRIRQRGSPEDIRSRPATPYVADLAGTNLLTGTNSNGVLTVDDHHLTLQASDTSTEGRVLITIAPAAIALHPEEPHGSPRNTWLTSVVAVEPLGDITRILLGSPLELAADITPTSTARLGLVPDTPIWATIKATEIVVTANQ